MPSFSLAARFEGGGGSGGGVGTSTMSFSITDNVFPMGNATGNIEDSSFSQLDSFTGLTGTVLFGDNIFGTSGLGVGASGNSYLYDADNTNRIGFRSPATVPADYFNVYPTTKLGRYETWVSTGPSGDTVNLTNQWIVISTGTLQAGTTIYIASGTVQGQFIVNQVANSTAAVFMSAIAGGGRPIVIRNTNAGVSGIRFDIDGTGGSGITTWGALDAVIQSDTNPGNERSNVSFYTVDEATLKETLRLQGSSTSGPPSVVFPIAETRFNFTGPSGESAEIYRGSSELVIDPNTTAFNAPERVRIGDGNAGTDYTLFFDGETNDGSFTWMEDENRFDFDDTVNFLGQKEVRFSDADSSHYVALKSSAVVTSSNTYILPSSSGTAGQAIVTDGNNNLSFATISSVGGSTATFNVFQFASTNTATVTGTTSETSLIGAGAGTLTFPANTFVPGYTFHVQVKGTYAQGSSTSLNLKLKLGGVTISESLASQILSEGDWNWDSVVTIRTSGSTGTLSPGSSILDVGTAGSTFQPPSAATAAVNTTIANTLEFTGQFDTTDSTFSCTNFLVNAFTVSTAAITLGGAQNTIQFFSNFDGTNSSPTPSVSIGDSLKTSVSGSTFTIAVDFSSVSSRGDTLDKEYWWPAAATQPLEASGDSVPPIVSTAGVHMDLLTTDFDSATDECRDVNFGVSTFSLVNVTTVTFLAYSFSASTGTGSFGWYFAHNSGIGGSNSVSVATATVASSFVATNPTRSGLNITSWDASLSSLGWVGGDWVEGIFCRDANNASDTMSGDLKAIAFSIILKKDR